MVGDQSLSYMAVTVQRSRSNKSLCCQRSGRVFDFQVHPQYHLYQLTTWSLVVTCRIITYKKTESTQFFPCPPIPCTRKARVLGVGASNKSLFGDWLVGSSSEKQDLVRKLYAVSKQTGLQGESAIIRYPSMGVGISFYRVGEKQRVKVGLTTQLGGPRTRTGLPGLMKLSWFSCPVAWLYVFVAVTCPVALACLVVSCLLAYLSSSSLAESSKPVKPYMELACLNREKI